MLGTPIVESAANPIIAAGQQAMLLFPWPCDEISDRTSSGNLLVAADLTLCGYARFKERPPIEKRLTVSFLLLSSVENTPHQYLFLRLQQAGLGKGSLLFKKNQALKLFQATY